MMSNDQVTVRRRRVVPKAPYTMEEVEFIITVDRPEGYTIEDTVKIVDSIETKILDQRLPLEPTKTSPMSKSDSKQVISSDDPYASLSWTQSPNHPALSTIRRNENPSPLEKELCDKIKSGNGKWRVGNRTYKLSRIDSGVEYLQRWLPN